MRLIVFLLMSLGLLAFWPHPAAGQEKQRPKQSRADSLQARLELPGLADTARVQLYFTLMYARDAEGTATPAVRRKLLLTALRQARRVGFVGGELEALNYLGALDVQTSEATASGYYNEAVRRARQTGETRFLAESFQGLGAAALEQHDLRLAADLYEKAVAAAEPLTPYYQQRTLIIALSGLSDTYLALGRLPEARRVFRRMRTLSQQRKDEVTEFLALAQWGSGLLKYEPDSAAAYLQQAHQLAVKLGSPYYQAYALLSLMQVRQQQKRWPETLDLARQTLQLARLSQTPDYEAEALKSLAEAMRHLGQAPAAFDTLQRAHALLDTLFSQKKREEFARQQVVFEVGEKEARIRKLEQQRRIGQLETDRQTARNRLLIGGLAGLLLLLTTGGGFYFRLRRTSAALAASEAQARRAETAARTAESHALAANATKDQIMSVIGHDLRGPVASFQQLTPVLRQLVPTGPGTAEAQRLLDSLAAGARHLGELLDNLLRWARTEDGQTPNYPTYLPAADLASAATELLQPLALSKQIGLRLHVAPPHLQVFADPDLLATVLRNLVANAIKFTPTGGQVTVSIDAATTGTVRITVTDTGIGIAPERIRNLLAIAGHDSTRGTAGELGTGLGLPLSARFVRLIGGELRLTSQPGQGTEAAFELPAPPPRFGA